MEATLSANSERNAAASVERRKREKASERERKGTWITVGKERQLSIDWTS